MATSTKTVGVTGSVQCPGTAVAGIKSWTLDQTADVVETTSFDDVGTAAYLGTVTRWSGSFEGYKAVGNVPIVISGDTTTITLNESTGSGQLWSGSCIITGIHVADAHDGLVTYGYDYQGTGELTEPTS